MYAIRHRVAGSYYHGPLGNGYAALWLQSPHGARRFLTPEDAFTEAYLVCTTTDPSNLEIVPLPIGRAMEAATA